MSIIKYNLHTNQQCTHTYTRTHIPLPHVYAPGRAAAPRCKYSYIYRLCASKNHVIYIQIRVHTARLFISVLFFFKEMIKSAAKYYEFSMQECSMACGIFETFLY